MICRLSFSGEMAFEVYSGAGHGTHVWEALIEAGKPFGMVPYGLEALGTLRIEKGHVTGAEIDGRTTARDLHLDWMLSKKKPFIGSMTMDREGLVATDRVALVGLVSLDNRPLAGGAHIVEQLDEAAPRGSIGHITRRLLFAGARQIYRAWHWSRAASRGTARAHSSPTRCASASVRSRSSAIISSIPKGAACMVEQLSPLQPVWKPGAHGKVLGGVGVVLRRRSPGSIVQAAALPGEEKHADRRDQGCDRPRFAGWRRRRRRQRRQGRVRHRAGALPGGRPGRRARPEAQGCRRADRPAPSPTCRMAAPRSASPARRPNGCWRNSSRSILRCRPSRRAPGVSTAHHDIFAQIQRTGRRSVRPLRLPLVRALVLDRRCATPARKSATR